MITIEDAEGRKPGKWPRRKGHREGSTELAKDGALLCSFLAGAPGGVRQSISRSWNRTLGRLVASGYRLRLRVPCHLLRMTRKLLSLSKWLR